MSAFGGDSWAADAGLRKRRVDDLMLPSSSSSSCKKLSNGKYACLVCPHRPVLDSPLSLSIHNRGSRHIAAETRLKEREISREAELNKRLALLADSKAMPNSSVSKDEMKCLKVQNKPLVEHTRKVITEIQSSTSCNQNTVDHCRSAVHRPNPFFCSPNAALHSIDNIGAPQNGRVDASSGESSSIVAAGEVLSYRNSEPSKLREKELKFTEAGWKRDGHGKWYKDENVEFDSDEEDPNVCLN
ncbi:hypothetical protein J5N97_003086 [Dioscorea zingiberensis]|uniref:Sodium channel modifier 1 n=1 Tax=Dioscorea zingiberensis TaxID=325984 RepID=A0A9D5D623_9LILI|nr:hypothetical protein J5N97_003086 [Dioscorea zingiberensis]